MRLSKSKNKNGYGSDESLRSRRIAEVKIAAGDLNAARKYALSKNKNGYGSDESLRSRQIAEEEMAAGDLNTARKYALSKNKNGYGSDESLRSRRIAEEKIAAGDLKSARKYALVAQRLSPEQDGLPLLLALLDVLLVLEENKDSVHSKWHKILQVDPSDDIASIRKQYTRLCRLLHPDSNKLIQRPDAFNLVTEAWKIACITSHSHGSLVDNCDDHDAPMVDDLALTLVQTPPSLEPLSFWTICPLCETRYEHLAIYENKFLFCSICNQPFVAVEHPLLPRLEGSLSGSLGNSQTGNENGRKEKTQLAVKRKGQGREALENLDRALVIMDGANELMVLEGGHDSLPASQGKSVERKNQRPRKSPRLMSTTSRPNMNKGESRGNLELKASSMQVINDMKKHINGKRHKLDICTPMNVDECEKRNTGLVDEHVNGTPSSKGSLVGSMLKCSSKQVGSKARGKVNHRAHVKSRNKVSDIPLLQDEFFDNEDQELKNPSMQIVPVEEELCNAATEEPEMSVDGMDKPSNITGVAMAIKQYNPDDVLDKAMQKRVPGLDRAMVSAPCYKQDTETALNAGISRGEDDRADASLEIECMQSESDQAHRLREKLFERMKNCIFQGFSQLDDDSLRNVQVIDVKEVEPYNHRNDILENASKDNGPRKSAFETIQFNLLVSFIYPNNFSSDQTIRENQEQKQQPCCLEPAPENLDDPNVVIAVSDTQFFEFDKERREDCFAAGQIWAIYDDDDGMPRYYARISKILSRKPFKVEMLWLNTESKNDFSCTCGEFKLGSCVSSEHVNVFSHIVRWKRGFRKRIKIYPRKGDVWALYRGWSASLKAKDRAYEYDIVEVISDHSEVSGITVVALLKVEGFRTLFQKLGHESEYSVSNEELGRFSHQIPVYRLADHEAPGLVEGCMELDTAATTWIT